MTSKSESESSSAEKRNIELVKQFFTALNGADIDGAVSLLADDIVRDEFPDVPKSKTYRGKKELHAHLAGGRSTWAEGACHPQEFSTAGNRVAVRTHVHVRQNGKTDWNEGYVTDTFEFCDGKITKFNSYLDRNEGLKWVGTEV